MHGNIGLLSCPVSRDINRSFATHRWHTQSLVKETRVLNRLIRTPARQRLCLVNLRKFET